MKKALFHTAVLLSGGFTIGLIAHNYALTDQQFLAVAVAVGVITGLGYWFVPSRPEPTSGTPMIDDKPAYIFDGCPECCAELSRFLAGPSGGMSQNVLCSICHHEYNIANLGGHLVIIDDLGTANEGRLKVYGVNDNE